MANPTDPPLTLPMRPGRSELSERLRLIREESFGDQRGAELAEMLGLPLQTWLNYESGVAVPGMVLLIFLVLLDIEPRWLLLGEGSRYRSPS